MVEPARQEFVQETRAWSIASVPAFLAAYKVSSYGRTFIQKMAYGTVNEGKDTHEYGESSKL